MNLYNKLARNPKLFLSFTGMHLHTFQELLPQFEQAYLQLEIQRKERLLRTGRTRKRAAGAGKPFSNDLTQLSYETEAIPTLARLRESACL